MSPARPCAPCLAGSSPCAHDRHTNRGKIHNPSRANWRAAGPKHIRPRNAKPQAIFAPHPFAYPPVMSRGNVRTVAPTSPSLVRPDPTRPTGFAGRECLPEKGDGPDKARQASTPTRKTCLRRCDLAIDFNHFYLRLVGHTSDKLRGTGVQAAFTPTRPSLFTLCLKFQLHHCVCLDSTSVVASHRNNLHK